MCADRCLLSRPCPLHAFRTGWGRQSSREEEKNSHYRLSPPLSKRPKRNGRPFSGSTDPSDSDGSTDDDELNSSVVREEGIADESDDTFHAMAAVETTPRADGRAAETDTPTMTISESPDIGAMLAQQEEIPDGPDVRGDRKVRQLRHHHFRAFPHTVSSSAPPHTRRVQ